MASTTNELLRRFRPDRLDAIMLAAVVVLLAALGLTILRGDQTGGSAARPATSAQILYMGPVKALVRDLFTVSANGGAPQQLTKSRFGVDSFAIAADGRIAFSELVQVDDKQNTNIMLYEGGKITVVYTCEDASCTEVAIRPDGNVIAFDRSDNNSGTGLAPGAPRVWLLDLTTGKAGRLFDDSQKIGYMPRWSPDGTRIALWDSNRGGIVLYNFTTREESSVPAYGGRVGEFSPDGARIWFTRVIEVQDAASGASQYVTHITIADISVQPYKLHDLILDSDPSDDTDPIWSADGKALYVLRRPAGSGLDQERQIYQLDSTTGAALPLVQDKAYAHSNLALDRAGNTLTFERFKLGGAGATPEVWSYDLKTKALRLVIADGMVPQWLP